ncbi:uncharacterized protein TRIADDRAFT_60356 [Trichoplax adhaerens]|uniref:Uncharacterized protein n=1 Tax=Trichoplax adhaerens TaxID=10228 RepID=B3S7Z9_TRIAD|nr:predicted protein [Trichoplax adhaerens]EDV21104.1 predicted protein [Trichoplax adhaerens]|eukprot:XP_002116434.1 predicted protein [Trichoplax adhaerens]
MNIRTNTILSDFLTLELFDLDSKLSNTKRQIIVRKAFQVCTLEPFSRGAQHCIFLKPKERPLEKWDLHKAENEGRDIEKLRETMLEKIERTKHAAVKDLQLFIDGCTKPENLPLLQDTVKRYRQSKSVPFDGLPALLTRTCIRLENPAMALEMIKNKACHIVPLCDCYRNVLSPYYIRLDANCCTLKLQAEYGIFPNAGCYNFLMDEFIDPRNRIEKGSDLALEAYDAMLADSIKPNKVTNAIRIYSLLKQDSEKDFLYGIKLLREFMETGLRVRHIKIIRKEIIRAALRQLVLYLYIKSLKDAKRQSEIMDAAEEHLKLFPTLKIKVPTITLINEAVTSLENPDLNEKFNAFEARLRSMNRINHVGDTTEE